MNEPASTAGENAPAETYDFPALVDELTRLLKLRTIPIGMKRFADRKEMEAIPRIRRPKEKMMLDQVVGQARLAGWTVGVTFEDLTGAQCGAPVGLYPRNGTFLAGSQMVGVWYATEKDAAAHQAAMDVPEDTC